MIDSGQFPLRIWDPNDKQIVPQFLQLLRAVFDSGVYNSDWFLWKHRDSLWGPSIVTYAVDTLDGHIVALRAFWPWKLVRGGEVILAYQPCDTAVHPDFRRRGLFTRLTKLAIDAAKQRGASVLFNFPNPLSKPGYLKLGWQEIGGMVTLLKPMKPLSIGFKLIANKGKIGTFVPDIRVQHRNSHEDVLVEQKLCFEDRASRQKDLWMGARTPRMLHWRFQKHPIISYQFVEHEDRVAVVRTGMRGKLREASILDVFCWDQDATKSICDLIELVGHRYDADIVTTVLTKGHPLLLAFQECGFWQVPSNINFVMLPLTDLVPSAEFEAWALTGCDIDTY